MILISIFLILYIKNIGKISFYLDPISLTDQLCPAPWQQW